MSKRLLRRCKRCGISGRRGIGYEDRQPTRENTLAKRYCSCSMPPSRSPKRRRYRATSCSACSARCAACPARCFSCSASSNGVGTTAGGTALLALPAATWPLRVVYASCRTDNSIASFRPSTGSQADGCCRTPARLRHKLCMASRRPLTATGISRWPCISPRPRRMSPVILAGHPTAPSSPANPPCRSLR